MVHDFLLLELECLNLVLHVVSFLLLTSLLRLACLVEHDDFELELTFDVKQLAMLLLQLLQLGPVLLDHLLLQRLVFLVQLKRLLLVDC